MSEPAAGSAGEQHRVIHTAQALVDVVLEVAHLPARGGNVMADSSTRYAGGAVNVLVAAARTGAAAVHAGAHGTGPSGDLVRAALAVERISWSDDPVPDLDTGICVVLVEPSAERTFVTTRGAERRISAASLARSAPRAGDLVCVSGYSLLEPTRDPLLDFLEALPSGVGVVLDPGAVFAGLDPQLRSRMLALTTVWTSNAQEAAELIGTPSAEPAEDSADYSSAVAESASAIAELLAPEALVVVRDGERGCHLVQRGSLTAVPGYPQRPVDTNGAGDAHVGVMVAELAAGTSPQEAARRANAAGAIKVRRRGPATAPTRAEIDQFLTDQG